MKFTFLLLPIILFCANLSAQDIANANKDSIMLYDSLALKARATQPRLALQYCLRGYQLAEQYNDTASVAYYLNFIGVLYKNMGLYKEALSYYDRALVLDEKLHNVAAMGAVYNNIAFVHKLQGNYPEALGAYLNALEIGKMENNLNIQNQVLNNIGNLYADQKNKTKALEYYRKSIAIAIQLQSSIGIAYGYNNIGELYLADNQTDSAFYYFQQSIQLKKPLQHYKGLASSYANLGRVYRSRQQLDSSNYYFNQALQFYTQLEDNNGKASIFVQLGENLDMEGDSIRALDYYQKSLEFALNMEAKPLAEAIYKRLSNYYAQKKQFDKAYLYQIQYQQVKDSILNLEHLKRLSSIETSYREQLAAQEIAQLQQTNKIQQLENEQQGNVQIMLLLGLVLAALILGFMVYRYRIKQQYNTTLELKNQEIATALGHRELLLKEIHHRVKNNLQIISSLLNLQSGYQENSVSKAFLQQIQDRIYAMSVIHERLYKSVDFQSVSLQEYVSNLVEHLASSYQLQHIEFKLDIAAIQLDIDALMPCGLIINELATNSIKYAFPNQEKGEIWVVAQKTENNHCQLTIRDTGKGLPADFSIYKMTSLGLKLVAGLVRQLKGKLTISSDKGAIFNIIFPLEAKD